jgi:hypothetical protein
MNNKTEVFFLAVKCFFINNPFDNDYHAEKHILFSEQRAMYYYRTIIALGFSKTIVSEVNVNLLRMAEKGVIFLYAKYLKKYASY